MAAIALSQFTEASLNLISIRGGEPTRHPGLGEIVALCGRIAKTICVETHGRWLLPDSVDASAALLREIKESDATIKLSFDRMHGLRPQQLRIITDFLNENRIRYLVAITDIDKSNFIETRQECHWIPDDKIVFQLKTTSIGDLSNPPLGVLNIGGKIVKNLNVKAEFAIERQHLPLKLRSLSI
jgi:hypothetical protein